jgi:uncharacterized protein (TIGR02186 family)
MRRGQGSVWSMTAATVATVVLFSCGLLGGDVSTATAQQRGRQVPVAPPKAKAAPTPTPAPVTPAPAPKADEPRMVPEPEESVQADVSTRNVAVTSSFTGTEIVVFGAIDNSRQASPEAGLYDVVIVIEGVPSNVTVRKKDRVGGIWLNTDSTTFESVPSYYAISSTRPLEEVAPEATLIGYEIGFDHVRMEPGGKGPRPSAQDLRDFRNAVVRLKVKDGLYVSEPHGVAFIGKSLFRSTIALPATVQVGPFETRVYLFRGERLISQYNVRISLEREGLERFLHNFAFDRPFLYGLATVILALCAGMAASAVFSKGSH